MERYSKPERLTPDEAATTHAVQQALPPAAGGAVRVAFFDTETNGPHLLQVAVHTAEYADTGEAVERTDVGTYTAYVRPLPHVHWHAGCEAVHGITREFAEREGLPLPAVMHDLARMFAGCHVLVAHNLSFDLRVLAAAECLAKTPVLPPEAWRVCTMRATADLCGLRDRRGGRKAPSLQELHLHLTGRHVFVPEAAEAAGLQAHDALFDVHKLCRCFERLLEEGELQCGSWAGPPPLLPLLPAVSNPRRARTAAAATN